MNLTLQSFLEAKGKPNTSEWYFPVEWCFGNGGWSVLTVSLVQS